MNRIYYISCVNCDTWIESIPLSGRRVFSSFEKAMEWISRNVLEWYKPEDVTVDGARHAWLVPAVGGKVIWEIEAVDVQ